MKKIFISDLHLSPKTLERNELFKQMLQQWQGSIAALYILGDFFDYWMGDNDHNPFMTEIKQQLNHFTKNTPVYFIVGNHDFAIGKKFAAETGVKLLKDCSTIKDNHKTILLSHGDVFCSLDTEYQRMKKLLTNPLILFILRTIPLSLRYKLKHYLEKSSKKAFTPQNTTKYYVVDSTIIKYAHKYKADIIIHGHTHHPNQYQIKTPQGTLERIEIPDWQDRPPGGYVSLENGNIKIITPKN